MASEDVDPASSSPVGASDGVAERGSDGHGSAPSGPAVDNHEGSSGGHHAGAKIFLGGLRFEVIQAGRHVVSWIFEAACGVHLPPNTILIHRRSKGAGGNLNTHGGGGGGMGNAGKNAIAPTGCASVFVADEKELDRLLAMNQRMFCATTGVYVADSPERMKQLLAAAQRSILDVVDGKIRGPTHPIVVEKANSSGGRGGGKQGRASQPALNANITSNNTSSSSYGAGRPYPYGGGAMDGGRRSYSGSSSHSDFLSSCGVYTNSSGVGLTPHGGGPPPPPYTATASGCHTPLLGGHTPASTLSGGFPSPPGIAFPTGPLPPAQAATHARRGAAGGSGGGADGSGDAVLSSAAMAAALGLLHGGGAPPRQPEMHTTLGNATFLRGGGGGGGSMSGPSPAPIAESPLSFQVYPGDAAIREAFAALDPSNNSGGDGSGGVGAFLGGLPADASPEYVSWILSLLGLRTSPSQIVKIGAAGDKATSPAESIATTPPAAPAPPSPTTTAAAAAAASVTTAVSMASSSASGGGGGGATGCAMVQLLSHEELASLLGCRDRVVATRRGVWLGKTTATIHNLLLEEPSLADCAPLFVERRAGPSVRGGQPGLSSAPPPPPPPPLAPPQHPPHPQQQQQQQMPPPPFGSLHQLPSLSAFGLSMANMGVSSGQQHARPPPPPLPPPYSGGGGTGLPPSYKQP